MSWGSEIKKTKSALYQDGIFGIIPKVYSNKGEYYEKRQFTSG